ncbi:uncharacterized protein LOC120008668 [Tripterygium wilfordii]|uniref:uncharacterized protein LOC120008668 n=1 Tax=Tripterygium wilfordii TaxID=458696 RepID=UPI0018F7F049|nr:uncharacterized protein LOC120008668 [Tripterygium wilfordii]
MEIPIYINISIFIALVTLTCVWNPTLSLKTCDFPAIFNLGDSNSDTGGLAASLITPTPPYGETFFHMPAGRFSDGRLIIDFIAKSFDLPYVDAYLDSLGTNFSHGANFATASATIGLPSRIIPGGGFSPFYLTIQYDQFIQFKRRSQMVRKKGPFFASLMPKKEYFSKALYTFDIGQNDLGEGFFANMSIAEVNASVPGIVDEFVTTVKNIYKLGGRSFWIHNTGPVGCLPYILANFLSAERDNVGCAKSYNEVAQYFNYKLREAVFQLRNDFQDGAFTYVDIYSAKYSLFKEPKRYGFELPLVACCGYGGQYNYSDSVGCGGTTTINGTQIFVGSCERPNVRVNWDGIHYTEAAAKFVFDQISTGNLSDPPIPLRMACHRTIGSSHDLMYILMELPYQLNIYHFVLILCFTCIWHPIFPLQSCDFQAIFNFGDSNSDTGAIAATPFLPPPTVPNGQTFFHMPSGRYSDGRLIIDFIAQSFGLPYLSSYLDSLGTNFLHGANFAAGGATIIPFPNPLVPLYLTMQYRQFEQFRLRSQIIREKGGIFASMMPKEEYFSNALYTFDIGQNDIGGKLFLADMSIQQINASIPHVINEFIANVKNIYKLGGRSFWIHNTGPIGCLPTFLTISNSIEMDDVGCAKPYNGLAQYFNYKLKESILQLRKDFEDVAITYVDVYSVKYSLFKEPTKYGFEFPLVVCCGYGGKYNFSLSAGCGTTLTINNAQTSLGSCEDPEAANKFVFYQSNDTQIFVGSCEHPDVRVSWDGTHYTEAANKFVFDQISTGLYSDPPVPLKLACQRDPQFFVPSETKNFHFQSIIVMEIPIYINVSIALVFVTLTCIWNPTFSLKSCDFPAIFNLGDSNSDTGGLAASLITPTPPYGETFFHMPVGRFSDGRLIIDFIAKSFDLPYLDAYLDSLGTNFSHGANFATASSTIGLPTTIIPVRRGFSPFYLTKQYDQFIQFKRRSQMIRKKGEKTFASLMPKEEYFSKALYTFDIGQNDLAEGFLTNMSIAEVNASVPGIVDEFVTTVKNIYKSGGRSFWIHNTGPIGCLPYILTNFLSAERDNVGCAKPHNEVAQNFNHKLREAVFQLRNDFQDGAFTYVDIYSAKYSFFKEPKRYGFQLPLVACCGYGGKYNYSNSVGCGGTITINGTQIFIGSCELPNARVNWDGVHYTEVAAKYVFDQISTGNFSDPPIPLKMACHRTIDIEM